MSENSKETAIRNFIDALEKNEIDNAMQFFTDDAIWTSAEGIFQGTEEIKKYTQWMMDSLEGLKFAEDGIGVAIDGDRAVYQHTFTGINEGVSLTTRGVCTYEFSGNKCSKHYTLSDRLTMAQQAAKGPFARTAVKSIINRLQKGLG